LFILLIIATPLPLLEFFQVIFCSLPDGPDTSYGKRSASLSILPVSVYICTTTRLMFRLPGDGFPSSKLLRLEQ